MAGKQGRITHLRVATRARKAGGFYSHFTGIDVSTDGGKTWTAGKFTGDWHRYSWRKWESAWDAAAGSHTIMARATDSLGRVQPTSRAFNRLGYRWNVIHAVKVDVA